MPEAVIVAYGRSPIGRANKGSLVDIRPDDLAAHVTDKVLQKVPALQRTTVDDLMCGCGLPAGEQGFNIGRVVSILARLDVPGTTVNRYCASSLQTSRMAFHAIKAGEGDAYLSVGVGEVREPAAAARQRGGVSGHLHHDGGHRRERRRARGDCPRGDGPLRRQEPDARRPVPG
jgi:acetyl-CoA C-acetyltransferase